jgi:hypothetical protein
LQLRGHDDVGLGFNISTGFDCDGIFVSQVHERGPAHDSGLVHQGSTMFFFISYLVRYHQDFILSFLVRLLLLLPRQVTE